MDRPVRTYEFATSTWTLPEEYTAPHALCGQGVYLLNHSEDSESNANPNVGSFGQVVASKHTPTGAGVAIKRFTRVFVSTEDAKRVFREVHLLRLLTRDGASPDVIRLLDCFSAQHSAADLTDLYIVMPLIPCDLHRVIYARVFLG